MWGDPYSRRRVRRGYRSRPGCLSYVIALTILVFAVSWLITLLSRMLGIH